MRISKTKLVQRVDDVLVLMDESTGAEIVLLESDVPGFRADLASEDFQGAKDDVAEIYFTAEELPRVIEALDILFPIPSPR